MSAAAQWQCGASLAFVAHQALLRSRHPTSITSSLVMLPSRREPEDDVVLTFVDKIGNALSTPTPGFSSLPIVYPLILTSAAILLPLPTSLLLTAFFTGYSFLGKQVVGEDDESELDFAALLAAIPSAVLLSPSGFGNFNGQALALVLAVLGLGLTAATLIEAAPTEDEKLLDKWDDKFDKDFRD
jgi:hypothetical protein